MELIMGVLSDQLRATVDAMRESDERLARITRDHISRSRALLDEFETAPSDPIADAVALLESHGYKITAPD